MRTSSDHQQLLGDVVIIDATRIVAIATFDVVVVVIGGGDGGNGWIHLSISASAGDRRRAANNEMAHGEKKGGKCASNCYTQLSLRLLVGAYEYYEQFHQIHHSKSAGGALLL